MKWQTRDYARARPMTVKEQIKYNFSIPWWKLLRMLAVAGFITTEPGCYLRLRDFTPFFWRTLVAHKEEYLKLEINRLAVLNKMVATTKYEQGLNDGYDLCLQRLKDSIGTH